MSKTKADLSLLHPVQVQTSDTIVLDELARFVTHAGLHRELFEAISAGNSELARSLAHRILDTTEQKMQQLAGRST